MNIKKIFLFLLVVSLIGCSPVLVPVVGTIPNCPITSGFTDSCNPLAAIDDDATYGDLLRTYLQDRQALESCSLRHQHLANALKECNDAIDKLNVEIEKRNTAARKN